MVRWKYRVFFLQTSAVVQQNPDRHSLIYLPHPFIVHGSESSRYREQHYWESYFIIHGLLISGMHATAKGMILNFAHLIDRLVGFKFLFLTKRGERLRYRVGYRLKTISIRMKTTEASRDICITDLAISRWEVVCIIKNARILHCCRLWLICTGCIRLPIKKMR